VGASVSGKGCSDGWGPGVSGRKEEADVPLRLRADWAVGRFSGRAGSFPVALLFLFFSFLFFFSYFSVFYFFLNFFQFGLN
jgi:hypothetical protein